MTRLVTGATVQSIYELLISIPPMRGWRLPPSEKVLFRVLHMKDCYALYEPDPHTITISSAKNAHLTTMIKSTGHEMIHLKLSIQKCPNWHLHGDEFNGLAEEVANCLGFDPKEF
jgi:hypothetical protein